jgi:hypothetical protein
LYAGLVLSQCEQLLTCRAFLGPEWDHFSHRCPPRVYVYPLTVFPHQDAPAGHVRRSFCLLDLPVPQPPHKWEPP